MAKKKPVISKNNVAVKAEKKVAPAKATNVNVVFIAAAMFGAAMVVVYNYIRPGTLPTKTLRLAAARAARQPARIHHAPRPALLPAAKTEVFGVTGANSMRGMG